jgi:hypothetical protein
MNIISTARPWFALRASDRSYAPVAKRGKRGLIGIFALLLGVLTAGSLAAAEDYEDFLARANQNFRKNNLPEALNLYKKANAMKGKDVGGLALFQQEASRKCKGAFAIVIFHAICLADIPHHHSERLHRRAGAIRIPAWRIRVGAKIAI